MMETMGKPDKDIDDVVKHILDDVQKRIEAAYQRGLEDGKAQDSHGCEGCEWDGTPFDVCSKCRNSYGNLYKRKEPYDKIEVGDEVEWDNEFGDRFVVTRIYQPYGQKEQCDGIGDDGDVCRAVLIESLVKTGRHFDIMKILKEMQT